jgi:hypothetical protein
MTQNEMILEHLRGGKSITPLEALDKFGSFRLGARIYDLRQSGHVISTTYIDAGERRRVARYTLLREAHK